MSIGHPVLWINIIINLPPLKLRPAIIIINDSFFLLANVSACNWVSFAKKDSKCHLCGNPKARWLNWNNCSVTCKQSLLWSSWVRSQKVALLESCQTFEVAAAQTSGPVNLVLSLQTVCLSMLPFIRVYWQTYGHDQDRCGKRTAIRPGFKSISQRHAAHVQQRSFSIHAESFQVCQNQASLIKASAGCKVL